MTTVDDGIVVGGQRLNFVAHADLLSGSNNWMKNQYSQVLQHRASRRATTPSDVALAMGSPVHIASGRTNKPFAVSLPVNTMATIVGSAATADKGFAVPIAP
jgi:hypothetical protein